LSHWLCIQPACDSVRLAADPPTTFLMLPLEPVDHKEKGVKAAFAVQSETGEWVHLWPWDGSSDIELMRLRPNHQGAVQFIPSDDDADGAAPKIVSTEEGITLVWVAQLKTAHALRVVHEYGTKLSRIGLDESEWIRRRGREGKKPPRMKRVPVAVRAAHPGGGEGAAGDVPEDAGQEGGPGSPAGGSGRQPVEPPAETRPSEAGPATGASDHPHRT
jgi:hypothetical protein